MYALIRHNIKTANLPEEYCTCPSCTTKRFRCCTVAPDRRAFGFLRAGTSVPFVASHECTMGLISGEFGRQVKDCIFVMILNSALKAICILVGYIWLLTILQRQSFPAEHLSSDDVHYIDQCMSYSTNVSTQFLCQ